VKRPSPIEVLLLLLILAGIGAHALTVQDPRQRNFVFAPNMAEAPYYQSQDPNPFFADGKQLQRLPAGTIARGAEPYHTGDALLDRTTEWRKLSKAQQTAWDAVRPPWDFDKLKVRDKAAVLARGQAVFTTFCVVCHGPTGNGDGAAAKRGVSPPTKYSDERVRGMTDGHLMRSITFGRGNMAAYASQVEREDRWKVIRYIRSLMQTP